MDDLPASSQPAASPIPAKKPSQRQRERAKNAEKMRKYRAKKAAAEHQHSGPTPGSSLVSPRSVRRLTAPIRKQLAALLTLPCGEPRPLEQQVQICVDVLKSFPPGVLEAVLAQFGYVRKPLANAAGQDGLNTPGASPTYAGTIPQTSDRTDVTQLADANGPTLKKQRI
ncbi:hypothetical protein N2152v2_007216 [Parachlorella kessleri]